MSSSWICLDASLIVKLVADPKEKALKGQFQQWQTSYQLVAPTLLFYEVTNALFQYQRHGVHSPAVTQSALLSVQTLPLQLYGDQHLHQQALQLAQQHGLAATYDAHYLALAQRLGAELWTADRKLANAVKAKLDWVKLWE